MQNKNDTPRFSQKLLHKRKLICGSLSVKQSLPQTEQQKAKIDSECVFQFVVSSVLKRKGRARSKRLRSTWRSRGDQVTCPRGSPRQPLRHVRLEIPARRFSGHLCVVWMKTVSFRALQETSFGPREMGAKVVCRGLHSAAHPRYTLKIAWLWTFSDRRRPTVTTRGRGLLFRLLLLKTL